MQVRLVEFRHTNDLIAAMEAGQADVAVGPTPPGWDGPVTPIGTEEFLIVAAPGAELPGARAAVSTACLADRDWVHFTPPSGLADVLDAACASAGFTPRAAVRTEQAPSALNLARAGLGITLIPGNVIPPSFDGVLGLPRSPGPAHLVGLHPGPPRSHHRRVRPGESATTPWPPRPTCTPSWPPDQTADLRGQRTAVPRPGRKSGRL